MGIYSEYLKHGFHNFDEITQERRKWLAKISEIRGGRNIITYASAVTKRGDISIDEGDLIPFVDTVSSLDSTKGLDIILETPGGSAETVEKIVRSLRSKFSHIAVIIPRMAMSAGTIFTMAADEILMGEISSLGPIDAQIPFNGRFLPADAIIDGVEKIKEEVVKNNGKLNPAYIPILQNINPGIISHCQTAQEFSKSLVRHWLKEYKFSHWETHSSNGVPVTEREKEKRAAEIAAALCSHSKWLTHGRSLGIKELSDLKLEIINYSQDSNLNEAITRYFILLIMTFDMTSIFKIFETPTAYVIKQAIPNVPTPPPFPTSLNNLNTQPHNKALIQFICPACKQTVNVQGNFIQGIPLVSGHIAFPRNNKLVCPFCHQESDVFPIRMQIEAREGKKIL